MASLKEKIKNDLNLALKARDAKTVSVLRMLSSAVRNKEISMRQGENVELDDAQATEVIVSETKKRRDSVEAFEKGNRQDLADGEKEEIKILQAYLPEQLSDEELEKIVRETAESAGAGASFGAVMANLMPKVKGKADGNRVSAMVKKII